ncbi:MAG: glycosyltransferase family 9 protein [Nitrospirae bacterium]|nr:glycosyltransferase family 9 protein [Nitrospirota bacterium]
MKPGNIFIHHDGALGDTLLSLPCISIIRESASHIHMAGRRDVVCFLKEAGIADEVSSADRGLYCSLYTGSLDEALASFLSGFDMSFIFTVNAESQLVRNVRSVIPGAQAILTIPPETNPEHAAQFRARQCGNGEGAAQRNITIRVPDKEKIWAADLLRRQGCLFPGCRLIMVHPGSGGRKKCWPLEDYALLIRLVMSDPLLFCLVLSGPAEDAETVRALEQLAVSDKRIVHLHDAPLIRIAALFERAGCYIGNDSGVSHLAGIMKCRGMVLFGPTDPGIWKPTGNSLEVLHFEGASHTALAGKIHRRVKELYY